MKLHHIGIVCSETDIDRFIFKPKKKYVYFDNHQNNKLIIEYNQFNNLWMVFIIPRNENSTVYKFLNKKGPGVHHIAYKTKNILQKKRALNKKKGFIYINSFKTNIPCFGGLIKTMFFYNNNLIIEFLENVNKK